MKIPKFYFDGNLYFSTIASLDDWNKMRQVYDKKAILSARKLISSEGNYFDYFGLYREYDGVTLREFLSQEGVNIESLP